MTDYAHAYRGVRERVSSLVREAGDDGIESIAPAAPEWRVRDVVAHLSGICADVLDGNLEGVATDSWTATQVDHRRGWPIEELLAEWEEKGRAIEAMVPDFPEIVVGQMIADAVTHEHDIRGALGTPGARDSDAVDIGCRWGAQVLDGSVPLCLETDAGPVLVGEGDPVATVRASRFELARTMTGRRSLDQVRAYDWDGEPRAEQLVLAIFAPRPTPLVE